VSVFKKSNVNSKRKGKKVITNILAGIAIGGVLIFLACGVFLFLLFAVLIYLLIFLANGNKEHKLMRIEMKKLADQISQLKDHNKGYKKSNSPSESE